MKSGWEEGPQLKAPCSGPWLCPLCSPSECSQHSSSGWFCSSLQQDFSVQFAPCCGKGSGESNSIYVKQVWVPYRTCQGAPRTVLSAIQINVGFAKFLHPTVRWIDFCWKISSLYLVRLSLSGNSGWIVIWEKPWELKKVSTLKKKRSQRLKI